MCGGGEESSLLFASFLPPHTSARSKVRHFVGGVASCSSFLIIAISAATKNGWLVFFAGSLGSQKQKVMSFIKGDREIERKMGEEVDPYYLKVALKHPPQMKPMKMTRRGVLCCCLLPRAFLSSLTIFTLLPYLDRP